MLTLDMPGAHTSIMFSMGTMFHLRGRKAILKQKAMLDGSYRVSDPPPVAPPPIKRDSKMKRVWDRFRKWSSREIVRDNFKFCFFVFLVIAVIVGLCGGLLVAIEKEQATTTASAVTWARTHHVSMTGCSSDNSKMFCRMSDGRVLTYLQGETHPILVSQTE